MMSNSIRELIRSLRSDVTVDYTPVINRLKSRSTVKARKRRSNRFLKHHTWDASDNMFNLNKIMQNKENIFLGVSDVEDLITSEIMQNRVNANLTTVQRETTVLANRDTWKKWAEEVYKDCLFVQTNSSSGFIVEKETHNFIKFDVNSNSTTVRAFGDAEFAEDMVEIVEEQFDIVTSYIEWVYGGDGHSVNVPLNRARLPIKEMYPFLGDESLEDYYDRYMDSNANILLLIGPPGTGKTTFIRGLLAHRNASAIVTYDSGILDKDGFFARFIEDDAEVMVLEDSDAFLKSRTDGNTMMHRFLNVGDGLVTTKGKKMVFSTNLPSIRDIDPALIRPGRCFDIVEFKPLSLFDANKLADKLGGKVPQKKAGEVVEFSIAEIFNQQSEQTQNAKTNRKVGFI
jgi:SpoVK/Ycf46/Vps4 family AAA+-type ATPase